MSEKLNFRITVGYFFKLCQYLTEKILKNIFFSVYERYRLAVNGER